MKFKIIKKPFSQEIVMWLVATIILSIPVVFLRSDFNLLADGEKLFIVGLPFVLIVSWYLSYIKIVKEG